MIVKIVQWTAKENKNFLLYEQKNEREAKRKKKIKVAKNKNKERNLWLLSLLLVFWRQAVREMNLIEGE